MPDIIPTQEYLSLLNEATEFINAKLAPEPQLSSPRVMIICGSGLGGIADILSNQLEIPYNLIPGFKTSTVPGHSGKLLFGLIGVNKVPVMCMVGRLHYYEGYNFQETTFPVRLAKKLGIDTVIVTNAAGGVNPGFKPGDLMVINDHINFPGLAGNHVLRGENLVDFGPRFQPLSDAYDYELRKLLFSKAASITDRKIHEGCYFFAAGPTFETRAEVRMIRMLGGDSVGMSTVPEVIVARHSGMKVLAVSLITNACVGELPPSGLDVDVKKMDEGMASHAEVLETADEASKDVQKIIEATVNSL
ncbi:Purine nucleoside phosphorylase [Spathaspora sp. JA1]|nr:Purine nucleoside phosphorylase [Spathaspora sp. JA1]